MLFDVINECSISLQGPCCTNDCEFRHSDKCRDDNGCRGESFCDGTGPQCPNSDLKPNKTVCHEEFVCYKGVSNFIIFLNLSVFCSFFAPLFHYVMVNFTSILWAAFAQISLRPKSTYLKCKYRKAAQ